MKKSILSLLVIGALISGSLLSCGQQKTPSSSEGNNTVTEDNNANENTENNQNQNTPADTSDSNDKNPALVGENNKPTVNIAKIGNVSDFKEKDEKSIKSLLGNPENKNNSVYTYVKDDYTFEVTYTDSKCGKIKVTPKKDLKYPADAANVLHLFGIDAGQPDNMTPSSFSWKNQFDTYLITVNSDDAVVDKIKNIEIIFDKNYE